MKLVLNIIDRVILALGFLAACAAVMMMIHVTLDVVLDVLFNRPLPGTLIIVSNYYMPLVTFLPLAFVERLENHVSADVLTQFLPDRGQTHLFGWTFVLCFTVCAVLTYATWLEAVDKFHIGAFKMERGMKVPTWPIRFAAPIGYGILTLLFLFKFVAYIIRSNVLREGQNSLGILGTNDGVNE